MRTAGWDKVDSAAFYWQYKKDEQVIVKRTYFFRDNEYVRYNDGRLQVRDAAVCACARESRLEGGSCTRRSRVKK